MKRTIKKVAVLGSGVMGSRIACHFANIGVEVILLDIVPFELNTQEKAKGLTLEMPAVRNRLVNEALNFALKSKPSPIYDKKFASVIQTGNFSDDMHRIAEADWIIEVVVERLDIKKQIFDQVEKYRKTGTLITSNTSGIPMQLMIDGRSDDFKKHFCGTHFFNPPRYLRLLEIIPSSETSTEVVDFLTHYGDLYLGKEPVLCKDTPAFIANRVGVYSLMSSIHATEKMGLSVSEVDKLTGTIIGHAKSATFRTSDVVGLDTTVNVSNNLYQALTHDESRETFKLPKIVKKLAEKKWLGDKTKQGFFKKTRTPEGKRKILELNLQTLEYQDRIRAKFPVLEKVKDIENLKERLPILVSAKDQAGEFYRETFYDLFRYVTYRIPEISDELYRIDAAICAGFAWELGAFQKWDILGVRETLTKMEEMGHKPAQWVYEMLEGGFETFYSSQNGVTTFYDISSKSYKPIAGVEDFIILDNLRKTNKIWGNEGATLFDLGDGVLGLEFHTKMNAIGTEIIQGIHTGIEKAEKEFCGLVIGNEGQNFSAGANLALLFMFACDQDFDEIDMMIRQFQQTMIRARYSSIPVISAPSGLTLGGGCELSMHCDKVQAHAETYIGLVEFGVGLIPAGGGTKEFMLRTSDSYAKEDPEFNRLQETFMTIATATVATSAHEAKNLNILRPTDGITLNRKRVLSDAKQAAIDLWNSGYTQPVERQDIKVHGKAILANLYAGINGMKLGNYISDHDAKIARKLAYVMAGGDLSYATKVSEEYLLDLEREAFLSLTGEKKTLERIQSILVKGKPLRN